MSKTILIGAPIDSGQRYPGCLMGPAAYRVAGIAQAIRDLGHGVEDWGDVALPDLKPLTCPTRPSIPWPKLSAGRDPRRPRR
jgi:arginase